MKNFPAFYSSVYLFLHSFFINELNSLILGETLNYKEVAPFGDNFTQETKFEQRNLNNWDLRCIHKKYT